MVGDFGSRYGKTKADDNFARGVAVNSAKSAKTSSLLDQAVLESLLATYADSEVVSAAIERWRSHTAEQGPDSASQVRRLEAEISCNESAVQRYYNAFENGRLPEARFGIRVDALERRLAELR